MANEDQSKGKMKDMGGKLKEEFGDATGNDEMKHEGQGDQAEGKLQKGFGDAKEKMSDK
ncbi:MAG: CsbD family protein [Paracoccaceae bacterium]